MTAIEAYILAKKIALGAVSGIKNITFNDNTKQIVFNFNDGSSGGLTVPMPKDGISITNVEIDSNKHLICTLSDNSIVDAGELPGGIGGGLVQVKNKSALPAAGADNTLYLTQDDDILYYWDNKDKLYRPVTGGSGANGIDFKTSSDIEFDGIEQTFDLPVDDKKVSIYINGMYLTEEEDYTIDRTISPNQITFEEVWEETDLCTIVWIKGNITEGEQTDVDLSDYYTKQQVDKLIADNTIITLKDTTINNMSYLEDINLPCALHLVNSWLGGMFNDDIVYVRTAGDMMMRVYTVDNVMYELDIGPDGSLRVTNITNISDEIDAVKGELEVKITQSHNPTWVAWCENDNVLSEEDGPLSAHIIKIDINKFSRVPKLNEFGLLVSRNRWNEYRLCYCHVGWFEEERAILYVDYVVRVDRHDLYTKDEVDTLLEDKLITIKDTTITNISQLPMDKLPCCLHMINSTFYYEFNDDIIYVASVPGFMALWTMDGQIAYFTFNDDGVIIAVEQTSFVDGTTLVEQFYNKDQIDSMLAGAGSNGKITLATKEDIDNLFSNMGDIDTSSSIYATEADIDKLFNQGVI